MAKSTPRACIALDAGFSSCLLNTIVAFGALNARDCISQTRQQNGIIGVFKGFNVMIVGTVIHRAVYFGLFDTFKSFSKNDKLTTWMIAQGANLVSLIIIYPFATIRNR